MWGKKKPRAYLPSSINSIFFFGLMWKTPRQHGMDAKNYSAKPSKHACKLQQNKIMDIMLRAESIFWAVFGNRLD
jgi:hypothetical protein